MLYHYCKSCGHKNIYTMRAPNFCNSCGEPLMGSNASVKATKRVRPVEKESSEEGDAEDGLDINSVPKISNFKCSSSVGYAGGKKMKLDSFLPEISEENIEEEKPKTRKKRGRPRKKK